MALGHSLLLVLGAPLVCPGHEEHRQRNVCSASLQFSLEMAKPGESFYLTRVVWVRIGSGASARGDTVVSSPSWTTVRRGNCVSQTGKVKCLATHAWRLTVELQEE